jgi:hypothetical protein
MTHLEANSSVLDAIQPPPVIYCCSCGHPTNVDELSECPDCGALFCGKQARDCNAVCSCDVRPVV